MKIKFLVVAIVSIMLNACGDEEAFEATLNQKCAVVSDVERIVFDFYKEVAESNTRSSLDAPIVDETIPVYYYVNSDGEAIQIAELDQYGDKESFGITTVKFHDQERVGLAVVSQSSQINRVLYYAVGNDINTIEESPMLQQVYVDSPSLLANLCSMQKEREDGRGDVDDENDTDPDYDPDAGKGGSGGSTGTVAIYSYGPLLNTFWNEGTPFNNYTPSCSCGYCVKIGGHKPVGCVAVAIGQCIIYFTQHKDMLNSKTPMYDCSMYQNVEKTSVDKYDNNVREWVGKFIYGIAVGCKTKFDCKVSISETNDILNYLTSIGYSIKYSSGNLVRNDLSASLSDGCPVMVMGNSQASGERHAWIVDGMKFMSDKTYKYHVNWGNGANTDTAANNVWQDEIFYLHNKKSVKYDKGVEYIYFN